MSSATMNSTFGRCAGVAKAVIDDDHATGSKSAIAANQQDRDGIVQPK
jgi:hypothetical protein